MIDITKEKIFSLNVATKYDNLPRGRRGKRIHISTILRYVFDGVDGVKLEAIRFGGRLCTSAEAIQRFCEALTVSDTRLSPPQATVTRRHLEIESAQARVAAKCGA